MLVETLTPALELGPGESAVCRARVTNNSTVSARYAVRLHGLGPVGPYIRLGNDPVEPNTSIDFELPIVVPESFGVGEHGAAIEVRSDQRQEVPVIANFTVGIGTTDHIVAQIVPSVVRQHRRGKFKVEVINKRPVPTEVDLVGSAPNLMVRLDQAHVVLMPGETVLVKGHTKGPRHGVGEPITHVVTVESTANSMPQYSMASVQQRAIIPWKLRSGFVGLAVLLVWVLIAVVGVLWLSNKNSSKSASTATTQPGGVAADGSTPVTAPGTGAAGGSTAGANGTAAGGAGGAAGGKGGSSAGGSGSGTGSGSGAAAAGGKPAVPTQTVVRGIVKAGSTGADDGVHVTLTPTNAANDTASTATTGTATPGSAAAGSGAGASMVPANSLRAGLGFADSATTGRGGAQQSAGAMQQSGDSGATAIPTKRWPARYGTYSGTTLDLLRTFTVTSVSSGTDGAFQFSAVPLHRSYELSFAKIGYITKSVIINPTDDGKAVQVDVQLLPGDGLIDGMVTAGGAGLGGVSVSATDGTVVLASTTSTDAKNRGAWSLDGLSTPGTYTITFSLAGYGTQVAQVVLAAGEKKHNVIIAMTAGVGSLSGTIRTKGNPLGGITVTASAGDKTSSTTSLTEGALGTFDFPQLAIGQSYIITAAADGYITQSRSVTITGNQTGVDFDLVTTTGSIIGQVFVKQATGTADAVPLVNAGVSVSANGLRVNKPTAAAPDAGAFTIGDLPPGSYLVTISRYDTTTFSQLVTLVAGQVLDLGQIVVTHQDPPSVPSTGSLIVRSLDTLGQPINGSTVVLSDVGGRRPAVTVTMGATENTAIFNNIPVGTYNFTVAKNSYRPNTIGPVSVGLSQISKDVTLLKYGTARGTVINRVGGTQDIVSLDDRGLPTFQDKNGTTYVVSKAEPTNPTIYTDTTGTAIVRQSNGTYLRGTEPVVELTETVGNFPVAAPPAIPPAGAKTQQLKNYELLLYSVGATYGCITPIPVADSATPDPTDPYARLLWQIDPTQQLLPGTYVLRFSPPASDTGSSCAGHGRLPPGFAVVPIDADGNAATFTVAANSDARIVVPPIQVAPYPSVTDTVVVPYKAVGGGYSYTDFGAADAGTVSVKLTCPGGASANAVVAPAGQKATFSFSTTAIAALYATQPRTGFTLNTCTLTASSTVAGPPGGPALKFLPNSTPLPLALGDTTYQDQVVSIALVQDPNTVTGDVVWRDAGVSVGQPGATPAVTGLAITASGTPGFGSGTSTDTDGAGGATVTAPNPPPTPDTAFTPTITGNHFVFDADGNRQVIGTTDYAITAPNFDPSTMTVTANASSGSVAWAATGTGVSQTGNLATIVMHPKDGVINGSVSFHNPFPVIKTSPFAAPVPVPVAGSLTDVSVHATAPGAPSATTVSVSAAGSYKVQPAAAGTWGLDQTVAAGSELLQYNATLPTTKFVDPGQTVDATPVQYVVLGQVHVQVVDSNDVPITSTTAPGAKISFARDSTDTKASFPLSFTPVTAAALSATPTNDFIRLPVPDTTAPNVTLGYLLSLTVPGYEDAPQGITITDATDGSVTTAVSLTNIPIGIFESSNKTVTIKLKQLGSLTGTVTGKLLESTKPLNFVNDGLVVTAVRVNPGQPTDGDTFASAHTVPPSLSSDQTFSITLPSGDYDVTYTANDYVTVGPNRIHVGIGTAANADATMNLQLGQLTMTTLLRILPTPTPPLPSTSPVSIGVSLYLGSVADSALGAATPKYTFTTDALTGAGTQTGVYPGTYQVLITKEGLFPVLTTLTIPEGPDLGTRSLSKIALTTLIDGRITSNVNATNSANEAIALPSGIIETATFGKDSVTSGTAVVNRATLPGVTGSPAPEATPGAGSTIVLDGLPRGTNTVSFNTILGFGTTPASHDVLVTGTVPDSHATNTYKASDVVVNVTVVDHSGAGGTNVPIAGATVTMTPPAGSSSVTPIPLVATAVTNVYTANVPPRIGAYTVNVTASLHQPYSATRVVAPSASALDVPVVMQQAAAITGTVRTQSSSSTTALFTNSAVTLTDSHGVATPGLTDGNGVYSFPVNAADTYTVTVDSPPSGFGPGTTGPFAVALGTTATHDITMLKFSEVDLTIAGAPAAGFTVTPTPATGVTGTLVGSVYKFTGLTANTAYSFVATQTGFATQTYTFTAAANTPGLVQSATLTWTSLSGTLTNPSPSSVVTLSGPSGFSQQQTFTGSTGSYAFTGLAPGNYTISAVRAWDNLSTSVAFDLGGGSSVSNPTPATVNPKALALPTAQSATLTGKVVDQAGVKVTTASVTLKKGATTISGPAPVDGNGNYTFNTGVTVAGNDYVVFATATGYVAAQSAAVDVTSATNPYPVADITLNAFASAAVTLVNPPSSVTTVSVSPAGPTFTQTGNVFNFTGLLPGTVYTFSAGSSGGNTLVSVSTPSAAAGGAYPLSLTYETSTVTLTNPPAGTSVSITAGPTTASTSSPFVFNGLVTGSSYTVTASSTSGANQTSTFIADGTNNVTFAWTSATATYTNAPAGTANPTISPTTATTSSTASPFTFVNLIVGASYTISAPNQAPCTFVATTAAHNCPFTWVSATVTYVNAPAGTAAPSSNAGTVTTASASSPYTFTGLVPGTSYTFSTTGQPGCTFTASATSSSNTCTFTWADVAGSVAGLTATTGTATVQLFSGTTQATQIGATVNVTVAAPNFSFASLAPGTYNIMATDNSATPKKKNLVFTVNADGTTTPAQANAAWTMTVV